MPNGVSVSDLAFPVAPHADEPVASLGLGAPASAIPAGFDAIFQFDRALVGRQLVSNLAAKGLERLNSRVPYVPRSAPASLSSLVSPALGPLVGRAPTWGERFIELVLHSPWLSTLESALPLPSRSVSVDVGGVVATDTAAASGRDGSAAVPVAELQWRLEINHVTRHEVQVLASEFPSPSSPAPFEEARVTLGTGTIRLPAHVNAVTQRAGMLMWAELDFEGVHPVVEAEQEPVKVFLEDELGESLLSGVLVSLQAAGGVRLSPQIALGKGLSPSLLDAVRMPDIRVRRCLVHAHGREVLALCVDAPPDSGGSLGLVRPFLGDRAYAAYLHIRLLGPACAGLWKTSPFQRVLVEDLPVEFLESEDAEEILEGTARVRFRLNENPERIGVIASTGLRQDPIRILSEVEIRLVSLWDPHGDEISGIDDLKQPTIEPFVWLVHLFDPDPEPAEAGAAKIRMWDLAEKTFTPVFAPFVEDLPLTNMRGNTSSALAAVFFLADLRDTPVDVGHRGALLDAGDGGVLALE